MNFSKSVRKMIVFSVVFFFAFSFSQSAFSQTEGDEKEKTVITILNAMKSENRKDSVSGDDVIDFEGSVKISVKQADSETIITGDKVTYNRAKDMLFAEGNVGLEMNEKSGARQTVSATTLLFNTVTLEGIFDDARVVQAESNALNLPTGSTLIVSSDIFARDDSNTIAFKTGELTFCNDENPHWKIKASRIWLLPGNEFAFLNALIYVGKVPVLYLPAFYYPKDELIFNPVFGYKNRNGYFIQTSTYLYGRKPLEAEKSEDEKDLLSDYMSLVKPTKLMDQKMEGLILHNLDTEFTGDTSQYLKLLADWYSNLGFGVGLEGAFRPNDYITSVEGSAMLGFSKTIFQGTTSTYYYPYGDSGRIYYDESDFMGMNMPFRFKVNMKMNVSKPFSYSLSMPVYSDPFFNYDFGDRSEYMDWFSYLLNNPNAEADGKTEASKLEAAEITTFNWDSNFSYSPSLSVSLKPYLNTFSISNMTTSVIFTELTARNLDTTDRWNEYTPSRKFFYPSSVTPVKISLNISGDFIDTGYKYVRKPKKRKYEQSVELKAPESLSAADFSGSEPEDGGENSGEEESAGFEFDESRFPVLDYSRESVTIPTDIAYRLGYSINPSFTSQLSYASEPLYNAADFNWERLKSSYVQVQPNFSFNQKLGYKSDFAGMTNSLTFDPLYQAHPYISEDTSMGGYTKASRKSLEKTDYAASKFDIINANSFYFKPFVYYPNFKETGITYNSSIKLMRTEFKGDADKPEWDKLTADWTDDESITTHSLDVKLAATEFDEKIGQSLVLSSNLPPQVDKYYATFNAFVPHFNVTAESGFKRKSKTDDTWVNEQFRQSATLDFFNSTLKFSESFNYEVEENRPDALKLAITWNELQLAYTMKYTDTYELQRERGWVNLNKKDFVPYSASIAYAGKKNFHYWKNRIAFAPSLSSSIVVDCVRPTSSYLIFTPALSFKLNEFLELTFSSTTRNDVLFRYFQNAAGYEDMLPGEQNIFTDLMNSFRFDDERLRTASGFKLKSFNISLKHDLHDWDLKSEFKIEPRLVTKNGIKSYDFSPYFSLSVVWRPMESMKTEIVDKYGTVILNGSKEDTDGSL